MKKSILILLMLTLVFTAQALAGPTVKIGGRVGLNAGYHNSSKELTQNKENDVGTSFLELDTISYLSAKFASEDRYTGGHVEVNMGPTVKLRHAYGWYRMGDFAIMAGQTNTWLDAAPAEAQRLGPRELRGFGHIFALRLPQIGLKWENGSHGFQFFLRDSKLANLPLGLDTTGSDVYTVFPAVALAYRFKADSFSLTPSLSYIRTEVEGLPDGYDDSVATYFVKMPLTLRMGAFMLVVEAHYGQNFGGEYNNYPDLSRPALKPGGGFEDTMVMGGLVSAKYSFGDVALALGVGMEKFSNDAWKDHLGYNDDNFTRLGFYVDVPIKVHKFFMLHPEFLWLDYGDDPRTGQEAGKEWYLGIQFRFTF